jgi:hypothetical protein
LQTLLKPARIDELWTARESGFDEMLKAVVDVEKGILAVDAEMHSDLEASLLDGGSSQENLWGLNLYPLREKSGPDFIEFSSFINIRPSQNNRSMEVLDQAIREKITSVVRTLLI